MGPGGRPEIREVRQTSYVCDLGPGGVHRLRQTTLSGLLGRTSIVVEKNQKNREDNFSSKGLGELSGLSATEGLELS